MDHTIFLVRYPASEGNSFYCRQRRRCYCVKINSILAPPLRHAAVDVLNNRNMMNENPIYRIHFHGGVPPPVGKVAGGTQAMAECRGRREKWPVRTPAMSECCGSWGKWPVRTPATAECRGWCLHQPQFIYLFIHNVDKNFLPNRPFILSGPYNNY